MQLMGLYLMLTLVPLLLQVLRLEGRQLACQSQRLPSQSQLPAAHPLLLCHSQWAQPQSSQPLQSAQAPPV